MAKLEKKDISYKVYEEETNKYYQKAFRDFIAIVIVVAIAFLIG